MYSANSSWLQLIENFRCLCTGEKGQGRSVLMMVISLCASCSQKSFVERRCCGKLTYHYSLVMHACTLGRVNCFTSKVVRFTVWFQILCVKEGILQGEMALAANQSTGKSLLTRISSWNIQELEPWAWRMLAPIRMALSSFFAQQRLLGWMGSTSYLARSYPVWT